MTYDEAVTWMVNSVPMFQNVGQGAYKPGLATTEALDAHFGHPHRRFRTIHVGGTNGKGSCSHTLAAILQAAGYRVGLFTSPHLVDFRERIRVNGQPIDEESVVAFIEGGRSFFEPLHPSFFELTTALAFQYFAQQQVDVAVIEVGLGGRLDCTNIITPDLCVITNISLDHMALLGDTVAQIAVEKAGIIKGGIPVVIGESDPATRPVFEQRAAAVGAPICFASDGCHTPSDMPDYELKGYCQEHNIVTILTAVDELRRLGYHLSDDAVHDGCAHVCESTGLMGRWQTVSTAPLTVCDTGHNIGGWQYLVRQIADTPCRRRRLVMGFVNDKDLQPIFSILPRDAVYYFATPSVKRGLPAQSLRAVAHAHGIDGTAYDSVGAAYAAALADSGPDDFIYVGGSTFVVADFLRTR